MSSDLPRKGTGRAVVEFELKRRANGSENRVRMYYEQDEKARKKCEGRRLVTPLYMEAAAHAKAPINTIPCVLNLASSLYLRQLAHASFRSITCSCGRSVPA